MKFIADFHIHTKYSRATSPSMDLENIYRWAKIKGINLIGTGDFTHPGWFSELKKKLTLDEQGLLKKEKIIFLFQLTSGRRGFLFLDQNPDSIP